MIPKGIVHGLSDPAFQTVRGLNEENYFLHSKTAIRSLSTKPQMIFDLKKSIQTRKVSMEGSRAEPSGVLDLDIKGTGTASQKGASWSGAATPCRRKNPEQRSG